MEKMAEEASSNLMENDEIHQKNELVARLMNARKENEKLTSMIKVMSRNHASLCNQLTKLQEEYSRSSPKSMGKDLKLGLHIARNNNDGGFSKQKMDQILMDSRSSESESSEEKNSKFSMEVRKSPPLYWKKRKINHVLEHEKENSFMDTTDVSNEKAIQGYPAMSAVKKITTIRRRGEIATVSDGCQWRKYGQKMTSNSPWPRAYFRCAMSPSCPVKKQVQKCTQDSAIIITTYEGEHNHFLSPVAIAAMNDKSKNFNHASLIPDNHLPFPASIATISSMGSSPTITIDLTKKPNTNPNSIPMLGFEPVQPKFPAGLFMQQSSSVQNDPLASLKADPNFTAALAAAIADSMFKLGAPVQGTSTATKAQSSPFVTNYNSACS